MSDLSMQSCISERGHLKINATCRELYRWAHITEVSARWIELLACIAVFLQNTQIVIEKSYFRFFTDFLEILLKCATYLDGKCNDLKTFKKISDPVH